MIGIMGDLSELRASFDNDEDQYKMMLENLDNIYKGIEHYKTSDLPLV